MRIRRFNLGEEEALFEIYYSAIHLVACRDYTEEQINAWAPADLDRDLWMNRIRGINPFLAEIEGRPVGYADVQCTGYIDHFFVSGWHPRQGIGSALMKFVQLEAAHLGITELTSDVSRTAQPFFERFGFVLIEKRVPVIRGIAVPNALMRKMM